MSAPARLLALPRPAHVASAADGMPHTVDGHRIQAVRESWLVEDRWWTGRPLRRRYWEVVSAGGRNLVVFHDLHNDGWFAQRDQGRPQGAHPAQAARQEASRVTGRE